MASHSLKTYVKIILFIAAIAILINIFQRYLPLEYVYYNIDLFFAIIIPTILSQLLINKKLAFDFLKLNKIDVFNIFSILGLTVLSIFFLFLSKAILDDFSINFSVKNIDFIDLLIIMFFIAIFEELAFRGIIFQLLKLEYGASLAILSTSLVFALLHSQNMGFDFISFLNVFLAGIFMAYLVHKSGRILISTIFHFLWNISLPLFVGSNVSGNYYVSFVNFKNKDMFINNIFYGGEFGIESGLITTFVLVLLIILSNKFIKISPYSEAKYLRKLYKK